MPKLDRPFLILAACLALLCVFRVANPESSKIDETLSPVIRDFPLQLEGWKGTEDPVDENVYRILETRNLLSRVYEGPGGEKVHLFIVASDKDRRVAHPPEVCYTASGYTVTDGGSGSVDIGGESVPVKKFDARNDKNPGEETSVIYLYKVGDQYTANYYSQQLKFAVDRVTRSENRVLMIRLAARGKDAFSGFLRIVLAHLNQHAPAA